MVSAMSRVAVIGARGRMGTATQGAIDAAEGLELVPGIDVGDDIDTLARGGTEVAVDFTHPGAVMGNVRWCIEHGIHVVVGTSGVSGERLEQVREWLIGTEVGVLVVPNFSIGAVLMMRFAAEAARYFESVEIVEMHHPDKLDAPSGTAARTAELVADSREQAGCPPPPDATVTDPDGARGARVQGIPVHSVRVRGLVAHQEVLLGGVGETLNIRHDMLDRSAALPGVLAAIRAVPRRPGLTVGLEHVLA
jgi:4-hydroxy-tetrahydrodipicolinate reductase